MKTDRSEINGSLISYFSNLVKLNGGVNLAQGIPGFLPPKKLREIIQNTNLDKYHQYAPGYGNFEVLDFLNAKYNTVHSGAKILICNGATEAVSLIYNYLMTAVSSEVFNVAAFSPAYESYIHLPEIFGHDFFAFSTDEELYFDESAFSDFFIRNKIKLLFVASPGNPYGKTMSKSQIQFLTDLVEKNNAYLILDSVYSEIYFGSDKPYYPTDNISPNVFYVNSFSKKLSITGWRLGYFLMHESHFSKICNIHDYIGLCASSVSQQILAEYLKTGDLPEYENYIRSQISNNYEIVSKRLSANGFYCPKTDGGYFVWCRLPERFDDGLSFGLDLYEKWKTAIIPGEHFGKEWNKYIRINIARPQDEIKKGLDNIVKM